jgi:cytochrome d ubiquinol oxidase subunit I
VLDLDLALLSRAQFGFTVGFHILFPTLTIGLAWFLVTLEALWLKTGDHAWMRLYQLWVKIFALAFGMGVVSGIVLSYQFGTNFSRFSEAAGPVLGPLLAVEVLTAFFVEAGFIGVMLFGLHKVGPRLHFLATLLVALGTLNSAFWVLAANSWMHTPAGVELVDGVFVPVDWWAIIFNPSMPYRVAHMVLASFLTVSFVVAGVSAIYLLRREHVAVARKAFSLALWMALITAPTQLVVGDLHGLNTKEHQPVKVAAMEGLWETTRGAPLVLFALPDEAAETNRYAIEIPKLASLILTHEWDGEVQGLTSVPPEDRPPVAKVFWSFRVMVGIGMAMIGVALWAAIQRWRGRLYDDVWLHRACVALLPAGFVATIAGWLVAEIGRQPFTVYGLMRTADSLSPVIAEIVAFTFVAFVVVYTILLGVFLHFVRRLVLKGPPEYEAKAPVPAVRGAPPATLVDDAMPALRPAE